MSLAISPIRKFLRLSVLIAILILSTALQQGCAPREHQSYTATFPALGTLTNLTLEVPNTAIGRQWEAQINAELIRIGFELWEGEPNGTLGRLNRERWTDSRELIDLIQRAYEVTHLTNGAFDIRIGELVRSYGFVNNGERALSLDSLDQLISESKALRFEEHGDVYFLKGSNATLTLGGIAKGYAVDQCVRLLQEAGCKAGIVNIGGDLRVWGDIDAKPWLIGVEKPLTEELLAVLALKSGACATSGSYRNRYIASGDTIHHLIEPNSGLPTKGKSSVTVTAPTCELADALATGMFVMPLDTALALADSLEGVGILILTDEPALYQNEEMVQLREIYESQNYN